jgi:hypothetical protein
MGVQVLGTTGSAPSELNATIRAFAHCSKRTVGAVMYALSSAPCVRGSQDLSLHFVGAAAVTEYWLSGTTPSDNMVTLNGVIIKLQGDALPALLGQRSEGSIATMPRSGVCTVGFVEVEYGEPVPACA